MCLKVPFALPFVCSMLALAGCANTKIDFEKKLASAPTCCTDVSGIAYKALTYDKAAVSRLGDDKSPARQFSEGKSYFTALELPEYTAPYELQVKSLPYGGSLLPPKVQLLDQNFQVRKVINPEQFTFSNGTLSNNLFVNNDQSYRYMLVYTDPAKLGDKKSMRTASYSTTPVTPGGFMLYSGYDEKSEMLVSSGGQVEVLVKKYEPRKLQ